MTMANDVSQPATDREWLTELDTRLTSMAADIQDIKQAIIPKNEVELQIGEHTRRIQSLETTRSWVAYSIIGAVIGAIGMIVFGFPSNLTAHPGPYKPAAEQSAPSLPLTTPPQPGL